MDLLINTFGTRIRSSGERVVLQLPNTKTKKEYPIKSLEKIIILRPSSISAGAVELAINAGVDIVYLNHFGTPIGRMFPSAPKGPASLRRAQIIFSSSDEILNLAGILVSAKALSQIGYLKYLEIKYKKSFAREILQSETLLESVDIPTGGKKIRDKLFGIEGYIADKYFSCLKRLYWFAARKPRGRDKFNCALNYGYGILYNEVERACLYVGLDPYLGFYHTERYGKPSLVLDLVEQFRVPIVDSTVFPLFLENKMDRAENYERVSPGAYRLSAEGKRKIVEAVFNRLNQQILWDGKKREVKSVIRHQSERLAQYFLGKRKTYLPFSFDAVIKSFGSESQLTLKLK